MTDKQKKFCHEYIIDLNATQAAIRAGYSQDSADVIGCENLVKPNIKSYIADLKAKSAEILEVTHQEILARLKNWAESDITETIGLTPDQIKELPLEVRQLVTKYKHTVRYIPVPNGSPEKEEVIELHFVSKEKALEMINKHVGFYEADNKQKQGQIDYSALSNDVLKALEDASK